MNKQVLLTKRPEGAATADCFTVVETPIPTITEGQVLVKNSFMSLDPYMRGRMNDRTTYTQPTPLGAVMTGGTVGEVIESKNDALPVGSKVVGHLGWQQYGVGDASGLHIVDTTVLPASVYLGSVGMPGVTAWQGIRNILKPKSGETLVVSAASGAVGSVVGQLAKAQGVRVVGIAGGPDKCAYVTEELGFDACIDYKSFAGPEAEKELIAALRTAAPGGVDCYFENVGGMIGNAVMQCMNAFGRIAVCGLISSYDGVPGTITHPHLILTQRLLVQGFIVSDDLSSWPAALAELGKLVATGKLKYKETVLEGIESAPAGLVGLLRGSNFGKLVVRL
jgi:NADPH-dependent curcumin reductase CurA